MGHMLPHAFTAWGSLLVSVDYAVNTILKRLYIRKSLPSMPISGKTPRQVDRNAEIHIRKENGESVPDLAKAYGISEQRVHQILRGRRK
jgi:hypothetical protein